MLGQVLTRFGNSVPLNLDTALASRTSKPDARLDGMSATVQLTALARGATGTVAGVRIAAPGVAAGELDPADERMALRLIEIGFVQGAQLRVIAFGQPGDDPIGVRVGGRGGVSTFALRRKEASCVWVWPDVQP